MLADRKWSIGTGSGIRRLIGLVVTLLLAVAGLSQPALASADTPTVGSCTFDSLGEDAFTYDDPGRAAAITTDTSLVCTEQHEFAQAPNPARHAYDSVRCCVAPSGLVDEVLPNSGPIPQSLGAASRAEQLARKLNLNVNSPTTRQVLNSLVDTDVSSFVSQYRRGRIWRELPGEVAEMSVEDALRHSSAVRKLLIDNRFVK